MKNAFIILALIIAGGGWVANKYYQKAKKSGEEKDRFVELAKDHSEYTALFVREQLKEYHKDAFESAYIMWVLSPASELDLESHYDEEIYYRSVGKKISEAAKQAKRDDVNKALYEMAKHYGVELKINKPAPKTALKPASQEPKAERESPLKTGKLGDKRKLPSSRSDRRYDNR